MKNLFTFLILLGIPFPTFSQSPFRPIHTYSIVAIDEETGDMGVAVQSHWFSVGSIVTWGFPGVGVVATQSFADPSYGYLGLELMKGGKNAQDALKALLSIDRSPDVRQVAMISADGNIASHTGENCIDMAGHLVGKNYSVQANLMEKNTVWPAMAKAFESSKGSLAEKLMATLEAAEAEGGDIRGKQSAAILIVAGKTSGNPWKDRKMDLRVEDHPQPLVELKRLIHLHTAYALMDQGDHYVSLGDMVNAKSAYEQAAQMVPDNVEMVYWHAVTLVSVGQIEESLPLFKKVFTTLPIWKETTKRLVKAGLLPDDEKILGRILKQ